jgi:tetratricopeptide (TPR) repeat protein/predicted Ser/Thr protein kinase
MTDGRDDDSDLSSPLHRILTEFLDARHRGQDPDRGALLAAHPELASELEAFFLAHDRIDRLASPLRAAARAGNGSFAAVDPTDPTGETEPGPAPDGAFNPPDADPGDPAAGSVVRYFGDYEILGEIARGGMGVVYEARQRSLDRVVALKMILAGTLATEAEVQRFRLEAEAVGNLDHPHIVPIYEVGEHRGRHYFSMKRIDGESLARRLDAFAADPRAAARLVALVARAVHHAHQRGILHRDLKPANILLDSRGQPYVTDFGLARRVDADGELTQSGALVGSPPYMAAEQAEGRRGAITTATDVYGLGAILYATLTGRPPFRSDSVLETLDQVRHVEPEPPGALNRRVDRDLQTICLKCLRKEPERRYGSALELAEDLERWLDGRPIAARPVGRAERAWRWCRRNPAVAGLTCALAMALLALLVGLALGNVLLKEQRDRARSQEQLASERTRAAERERQRADRRARQARWVVDRMLTGVAERWMSQQPRMEPVQLEFLEDAARMYREFAREEGDDPAIRRERAKAESRLGDILQKLGRTEESEAAYRRAIDEQEALFRQYPDRAEYAHDLAASGNNLAILLIRSGKKGAAEPILRKSIEAWEALKGRTPQGAPRPESALVHGYGNLAALLIEQGRGPEAEPLLGRVVGLCEQVLAAEPGDILAQRGLVVALQNTARLIGGIPERRTEAEACVRRSLEVLDRLTAKTPGDAELRVLAANAHHRLGHLAFDERRFEESEAAHERFLERARGLARDFPNFPETRAVLAEARNCWAWYLVTVPDPSRRDSARAVALAREAIAGSPSDGNTWGTLGTALYYDGQWQAAVEALETALRHRDGGDASEWFVLAMAHARLGQRAPARSWYDRATRWAGEHGADDATLRRFSAEAAVLLDRLDRADDGAIGHLDRGFPADPFAR